MTWSLNSLEKDRLGFRLLAVGFWVQRFGFTVEGVGRG